MNSHNTLSFITTTACGQAIDGHGADVIKIFGMADLVLYSGCAVATLQ